MRLLRATRFTNSGLEVVRLRAVQLKWLGGSEKPIPDMVRKYRHTILDTLVDLAQLLQDYIAIVKGDVVPWDQLPGEESEMIDEDAPATEVEQITLHVKEVVESLLGLSATVQHPAPHDFTAFLAANTTLNERRDMNHVQELYPTLLHWQAIKLTGALSRIRQYLRYRQDSRTKSTLGAGEDQDRKGKRKVPSTFDLPTPRSKTPAESSPRQSDGHGDPEDTWLPSYTPSAGQQRIPPLPQEARLGPFECPICWCFVFFQDEIKWKTHVFRDLQPYASSSFKAHAGSLHADDLTVYGMAALLSLAKVERKWTDLDCPFCCVSQHSAAIYFQHVGRHMEKLSLFALPLVSNDVAGVTDEQEGASSAFEETSLGFESFPYSDTRSVSDFDDEDSNGSETSHEDFGNTDERQEVVDNAEESELQSTLAQLRPAVLEGDIDIVQRILLETSIPDDPKSMFLAARAGHHLVIQLLLETGFKPDPCIPLKGPRNHFATPMLAAIGQSNLQVVKVLAAANGFDPTRTRFDGRLYHEIARERRGPNWLEEENILKTAYESYRRVASSSQGV
ncbi:uncharacterized protein LMH87_008599 [Akanthomyces muscarius]|uniref:Ankyrin repeat protein n=1 Tax=Akanthomyces muscarius TaxID=2231603 RepID=A0A9W8QH62_AKAMU|nr:uncharacterized protein LMH87_008599 [Akanthomyces muscarius]KAJ4158052.1 hypothetical protein LMH87_008599 [Akanthomyces muscarius]